MQVYNDFIIVKPENQSSTIQVEDDIDTTIGIVIDIDTSSVPVVSSVAKGDRIIFAQYYCKPIEVDGEKLYIVKLEDVIAKI